MFPGQADFAWGILLHHHEMENLEFLREWKLPCFGDVDSEERSFSLGEEKDGGSPGDIIDLEVVWGHGSSQKWFGS